MKKFLLVLACTTATPALADTAPLPAPKEKAAPAAAPAGAPAKPAAGTTTSVVPPKGKYSKAQAMKILRIAEEIRSPERCEASVDLKTVQDGKDTVYDMRILRSSEHRAHVEFLSPPEERGRRMLARSHSYWSTFPDSKRVVAISRKEMIGNSVFAVADIFQIDPEEDYDSEIVAEETENGLKLLKLNLKGKHPDVPYDRIEYWVEESGSFPVKAKFFGVSGKHLKSLTIEERTQLAGRLRAGVTKMVDEVTKGHVSWWKTKTMKEMQVPDNVFTKEYLGQGR